MMVSDREIQLSLTNEHLHLILLPTEACNFRCVYCYEEYKYRQMKPEVVAGVKNLMTRRAADLRWLTLSWFGGEPLLARRVMEDVLLHARSLIRDNPNMQLESNATTNGYLLTRPVLEQLVDLGVSHYQITFDGPRAWHDRKRLRADGKGTFDRIWENLLSARSAAGAFTITVRLHVDRENASSIGEFLEAYRDAFGADPRFEIFIRGVGRLGGPNDAVLPVFDREEGERVIGAWRARALEMGLNTMHARAAETICYAARGNSFVVRADGRVNKCTVALEHPNNQVGRIRTDGTLELRRDLLVNWTRGLSTRDPAALHCPMKGYADPAPRRATAPTPKGVLWLQPASAPA